MEKSVIDKSKKRSMIKHFVITTITTFYFGFGMGVQMLGIKAGLSLEATLMIWISSLVLYIFAAFTSMEKVKEILYNQQTQKGGTE